MLEPLTGRLKWEQTIQGIRVEIPVRRGPVAALYGPLVVVWLVLVSIRYWHLLTGTHADSGEYTLQLIAIFLYAVGFCFFVCWLAFTFTGETILVLDNAEMKIERRVLGIELASRRFPNSQVMQVIYVSPGRMATNPTVIDPSSGKIQFREDNRKHTFAKGLSVVEAHALIQLMLNVYHFPKSFPPPIPEA